MSVASIFISFSLKCEEALLRRKEQNSRVMILWVLLFLGEGSRSRSILSQKILSRSFCPVPSPYEETEDSWGVWRFPWGSIASQGCSVSDPLGEGAQYLRMKPLWPESWFILQAQASCSCSSDEIRNAGTTSCPSVRLLCRQIILTVLFPG